jgi:nitrite reductase/ring-hydroxylating ferredoxin subunit/uncharacterized membrane protein
MATNSGAVASASSLTPAVDAGKRVSPRSLLSVVIEKLEAASPVDRVGAPLNSALHRLLRPGPVTDGLSGKPLGHPVHPALVCTPIGCWTGALAADLLGDARTARFLTGLGVLSALPVAATGASDWADTTGAEQRVGVFHLGANLAATALYTGSWWARRRGRPQVGISLGLVGAALVTAAGWLGGHMAYALGVGVDTNAFHGGPEDWTTMAGGGSGSVTEASAAGVSLVVVRTDAGDQPRVLANRCSHRGGPLAEGQLDGGCLQCPWHGSRFDVENGEVRRGPATMPQPVYEVRTQDGHLQVRRDEPRSLRTNPVRP